MNNQEFLEKISFKGEEWRDLDGYNLMFAVSNFGRVVRYEQSVTYFSKYGNPSTRLLEAKLLKQSKWNANADLRKHGSYLTVTLGNRSNRQRVLVHRLVAKLFIPNPNNYPHIDHRDGNRKNNHVSNLRWATPKANMNNPITVARIAKSLKDSVGKKRVQVVSFKNGKPLKIYPSVLATADDSFRPGCVHNCCTGRKQSHQGLQWKFLSDCKDLLSVCQSSLQLPSITHTPHPQLQPLEP